MCIRDRKKVRAADSFLSTSPSVIFCNPNVHFKSNWNHKLLFSVSCLRRQLKTLLSNATLQVFTVIWAESKSLKENTIKQWNGILWKLLSFVFSSEVWHEEVGFACCQSIVLKLHLKAICPLIPPRCYIHPYMGFYLPSLTPIFCVFHPTA